MEGESVPELKCMYTHQWDRQRGGGEGVQKNADSNVTRVYMTRRKKSNPFIFKTVLKTFTVVWRKQYVIWQ